jgi:MFS family permease
MNQPSAVSSLSSAARWRIIALLMGYAALGHLNRVGISVASSAVFIPQFGISETRMGWVYTAFLIVYTVGMLPGGWLIDAIGSGRAMTLFGLTMGIFVALTGALSWLATTSEELWIGLLLIRSIAGACNAPLHPGAAHVVSELIPADRRATANGTVTAGALIGVASCYPVFGWLIDRMGWPLAFLVSGAALAAYSLIWTVFASPSLPPPSAHTPANASESDGPATWKPLRHPGLWLLTMSYAGYSYFQYLFFYWMEFYFEHVLHVSEVESRQASFYIMLAQGAGMIVGGMSTDGICRILGTIGGRRTIVILGMGLGALFGRLGVNVTGYGNVALCLALSMAALGMCEGVFWTTATDLGGESRGFAGAFLNTGGNIGGLISPVLTPFMAQSIGWPAAITVACVISAAGGLIWLLIRIPPRSKE